MDWDKLRIFHAVAEAGSFTHAGDTLNLSQSAVSRQIATLEESLNVALFHRHARGLKMTEQGELLYRTAHDVFAQLAMAEAQMTENREKPQGVLKINTTIAFGTVWLTSRINAFVELYPDIEVSLVLADNELDLSMREADAAIRMTPPTQSDLIRRQLMTMRYHVYAAPEYLKRYGMPTSVRELDDHRLIVYGEDARPPTENLNWLLTEGVSRGQKRKPVLQVSNIYGIFRAVQSGLGIGALPDYMSQEADNLVEILPECRGPSITAYFVYPEELRDSMRIAVLRDFLLNQLKTNPF